MRELVWAFRGGITMVILKKGQSCELDVLVGDLQGRFKGHDFLSVVPGLNQAGLVLFNGANPIFPAGTNGKVPYPKVTHLERETLKFEAYNIPQRVELLLQAIRDTFTGIGFDELVVTAGEYNLTISMLAR